MLHSMGLPPSNKFGIPSSARPVCSIVGALSLATQVVKGFLAPGQSELVIALGVPICIGNTLEFLHEA